MFSDFLMLSSNDVLSSGEPVTGVFGGGGMFGDKLSGDSAIALYKC